ncbi:class I SAM-dependent methyltransferase [Thalassotalea sp. G20_0]|uniref:class I SAM-dependent DNA methyltransferase n=1 Tax=Thalassotalea sp. G20_0 TaxID=2821093 RepID=UPI001ADCF242|nr:class I SAM-dependent methyltransferase [Thalassotalea sp. G20_0]MBO9493513.1 class I SAM-dependent methyltransferase [Thalassotalea sp. G20_0]
MCADINYQVQSDYVHRLHQLFGNKGTKHLDLACGTGPHVRHFIDMGYQSCGLDINQPMLDIAELRCPEADFVLQDMCDFVARQPVDLITCFLYSIHYSDGIERLRSCIASAHAALNKGGLFCFNAVDKTKISNSSVVSHTAYSDNSHFVFSSGWNYCGTGDKQSLKLSIEKNTVEKRQFWQDEHPMVAIRFNELESLLCPLFEVYTFEHDYEKIIPLSANAGNAIFACVKI